MNNANGEKIKFFTNHVRQSEAPQNSAVILSWCDEARKRAEQIPPRNYTADGVGGIGGDKDEEPSKRSKQGATGNGKTTLSVEEQFYAEILRQLGYAPDEIIADDKIHRFSTRDDGTNLDGWYRLDAEDHTPFGIFGDWRLGDEKHYWRGQPTRPLTDEERTAQEKRRADRKSLEAKELRKEQLRVAKEAQKIFEELEGYPVLKTFPYLEKKNVGVHGYICQPDEYRIAIPVCENGNEITSLQYVYADGRKSYLFGGKIKGCWFVLSHPASGHTEIVIAEGYSTGATIHETVGLPVIVAFNAGNLKAVAIKIAAKYPDFSIIIAGDDDLKTQLKLGKNTGVEKAKEAAKTVKGIAVFPPFDRAADGDEPSDWNDLAALRGKDNVAKLFRQTIVEAKQHRESGDVPPGDIPPGDVPPESNKPPQRKPEVQIFTGHLARSVDDAEAVLIKANCSVMVRGQKLVIPVWTSYETSEENKKTEIVVLKAMTSANLAYELTRYATFVKYNARAKKCVPIEPPERMLTALLQKGQYDLPQVAGVISCPTLRRDGTILDRPGYDPVTRLWLHPDSNLKELHIPAHPTKKQAQAALQLFKDLLSGYSLETELDFAIAIAAILSVICRGAFTVAPSYLFNAHTAGEGKSHLVDTISTIVRGRPCPVITMSGDKAEDEKRLGALLLEGLPIVSLDNCSTNIGGDLLCQIGTQRLIKIRILSKSETPDCEWIGTMFYTGNNVSFYGDMTRRGLTANMDSNSEQPELRNFAFDPIKIVLADRAKYIAAGLTIVRARFVSNEHIECAPIGNFSDSGWSYAIRETLIWLGMPDPWKATEQSRSDDPARKSARELVRLWNDVLGMEKSYRVYEIIKKANETRSFQTEEGWAATKEEYMHPELRDFLIEQVGERRGFGIDATRFGQWLRKIKGQIHDRHRIVPDEMEGHHGQKWRLEAMA